MRWHAKRYAYHEHALREAAKALAQFMREAGLSEYRDERYTYRLSRERISVYAGETLLASFALTS